MFLFVGYLWLIGRTKDIHRVFEYHGAEHKTIAAYEHGDELVPDQVDRYPKEHVRCGTNFLIIVMIITIFVFTLFGTPGFLWRIGSRIVAIPIIAGIAYEALRLGARFHGSLVMRALMAPGIWLQKITTQQPDRRPDRGRDRVVRRGAASRGRGGRRGRLTPASEPRRARRCRCIAGAFRKMHAGIADDRGV